MKLIEIWLADFDKIYSLFQNFEKEETGFINEAYGLNKEEFKTFLALHKDYAEGKNLKEGYVPYTTYVLEDTGVYVGIFNFRHYLNDALANGAGHVGYIIDPIHRKQGYAKHGLKLILKIAKNYNIEELYLSCNKDNLASLNVQMRCGAYIHHVSINHIYTRIPIKPEIKIIIASHKVNRHIIFDDLYLPMYVGSYHHPNIGYSRDDIWDNISNLNPKYCELTGLYWCYKNLDCKYLGLVHYRRYFLSLTNKKELLYKDEALELLKQYKVLVPKKRRYYIQTIYKHYADSFSSSHLEVTRNVIKQLYPRYLGSFDEYMVERSGYVYNMFVMSKELSDSYCDWLFHVLAEVDRRIDTSEYNRFQLRYLGRIAERLFNVWLKQEIKEGRLKSGDIKELPYCYKGKVNWRRKIIAFLLAKFFHRKYKQSF